jgi:outer membrane protein OmpA-like peptidoglycan-associated protein
MRSGYRRFLRVTTGCLAVTICLQSAAHAGSKNVYSYYGKDVTAEDIVSRFLGSCSDAPGTAACREAMDTAIANGAFPFRTRGIRIRGEEAKQLETRAPDRKPIKVSTADTAHGTDHRAAEKSASSRHETGKCPNIDSSVALPITFALNSAILQTEAYTKLRQMAQAMKSETLGACKFEVEGHTDASGGTDLNLRLSKERAYAVKEFLVSMSIEPSRLVPVGKGEADPLPNSNPRAPENRRVQFRLAHN